MAGAKIQLKRANAASWTSVNTVLLAGEIGLESDTNKFKIGNGSTAWNSLAYSITTNLNASFLNDLGDVTITSAADGDFLRWNGSAWINDAVNLSTDTIGSYVQSLVAGTGVTLSNNSGEGATPTVAIGQAIGTSASVTFGQLTVNGQTNVGGNIIPNTNEAYDLGSASARFRDIYLSGTTINLGGAEITSNGTDISFSGGIGVSGSANFVGDLTGNADTATTLETSRAISLAGDLSGSASFDGSSDITITATVQPNSIALGTDTTGNYVATLTAGTGITLANNSGENASPTVTVDTTVIQARVTNVTDTEIGYLDGVTSAIQTQMDLKAPLASPTFTGTVTLPSGTVTSAMILDETIVNADISASAAIADTKLATISTASKVSNSATTATNANTASAIVARDASGNFAAGTITAALSGNASTATTLETSRTISLTGDVSGSVLFNGSSDASIAATIQPNSVALGTDTTGNYVNDLTAGTGVTVTHTPGEGSSPTVAIGQAVGTSASVTFAHVTADVTGNVTGNVTGSSGSTTGNAATATALQNARTISLSGDVSGSVSFNGSANVDITATVQPNSISLGTDTTGDFVSSLVAGTGVTLTNNTGESATPTVAIGQAVGTSASVTFAKVDTTGDVTVGGNLTVNGTTTTLNTETLAVEDNIVVLNSNVTGSPATNAGIEVERGDSTNVVLRWNESNDKWETTNDGSTYSTIATNGNIALGTDTTGNYVNDLTAGTGVSVTHTPGEGSSPTVAIGQAVGTSASVTFAAVTAPVIGNASTASALETTRTISLTGDVSGSVSFNGSADASISATIQPNSVSLGTDTTGNYVNDLTAGTGVTVTHTPGEGSSPTVAIGQAVGTSSSVTFAAVTAPVTGNVTGDVTGNAGTATALQTSRAISLGGDLSGSVSFNGTSDVTITAAVQPNSVALGTDTSGDYVQSLVAGTGVTLTNNSGETSTPTVAIGQAVGTSASVTFAAVTAPLIGNASTATVLQTARNIAGQSFDGSANISIAPTDLTGVTSSAAELNILDGATLSTAELNYVDGVTSAIQTQIDTKAPLASPTFTGTVTLPDNTVALGTKTTGDYVSALVAGTGVTLTNNSGETATPTIAIGQAVGTSASVTFANLTLSGDLIVSGTTTTINSETLTVDDNIIVLNNNATGAPSQNAGIEIERGSSNNVALRWNETSDKWEVTEDGSTYVDIATVSYVDGQTINTLDDISDVSTASAASGDFLKWNGSVWVNDPINLGSDTVGNYVNDITAGTGVTVTHTPGEGSSPTVAIGQAVGTSSSVTFAAVTAPLIGNVTGNADTATTLATSRTIELTGDVTGSVSFNGSANASITATIAANSVALGTDTTGNYMSALVAGTGITVTHTPGEGSSASVALNATLDNLSDVSAPSPSDGQFLKYVSASSAWVAENIIGTATISDTAPSSPLVGQLWYESDTGKTFVYYDSFWVEIIGSAGAQGPTGPTGPTGPVGPTGPAVTALDDIGNVIAPSPADGNFLKYISASAAWVPAVIPTINALDDIGNVNAPSPADGQFLKYVSASSAWVPVEVTTPKIYVDEYTDVVNDTEWTCPAGVTQVKLTLIGAGGAAGDVEAITSNSSTSSGFPGDSSGSTTFTVGGTTYAALGGKKGTNVSITGPIFTETGTNFYNTGSSSSSGSGTSPSFSRYPGCGGAPANASAETYLSFTDNTDTFDHTSKAKANGYPGQDGVIEVFQVTVVPSTTYSFSIGQGAGFTGTTESYMGSNGAVIIEYVV